MQTKSKTECDIEFYRKEYKKQKTLEQIVSSRKLNRPKTKKWHVAVSLAVLPFLSAGAILLTFTMEVSTVCRALIASFINVLIMETYLRFCLTEAVKCYQHYAKEETRRLCKCIPSCSEYALISLKRVFPLIVALLKIRKRLYVICDGGDYKIDFPLRKMSEDFESKIS